MCRHHLVGWEYMFLFMLGRKLELCMKAKSIYLITLFAVIFMDLPYNVSH